MTSTMPGTMPGAVSGAVAAAVAAAAALCMGRHGAAHGQHSRQSDNDSRLSQLAWPCTKSANGRGSCGICPQLLLEFQLFQPCLPLRWCSSARCGFDP